MSIEIIEFAGALSTKPGEGGCGPGSTGSARGVAVHAAEAVADQPDNYALGTPAAVNADSPGLYQRSERSRRRRAAEWSVSGLARIERALTPDAQSAPAGSGRGPVFLSASAARCR